MLVFFVIVLCVSCSQSETSDNSKPTLNSSPSVSLKLTDTQGFLEEISANRGNVVLVDFWATWCIPCVKKFPRIVETHNEFQDRGLVVISVSLDSPDDFDRVHKFLQERKAVFTNLISNFKSPLMATEQFDLPGPIPCYRLYDREGKLQQQFSVDPQAERQFNLEDIRSAVEQLLAEQ